MKALHIQLLVFEGCPLAGKARDALERAMDVLGLRGYEEVDILNAGAVEDLGGWGSPTILVNGRDITGNDKGDHVGCRVYDEADGVPSADTIVSALRQSLL